MNVIMRNNVFELSGTLYRVLHIDEPKDCIYAISLDRKNALPKYWSLSLFESADFQKLLRIVAPPAIGMIQVVHQLTSWFV